MCLYDWLTSASLPYTDCGLSVRWDPAEDSGGCDEFSPACIKDRWTDSEKELQHSLVSTIQGHRRRLKTHHQGLQLSSIIK